MRCAAPVTLVMSVGVASETKVLAIKKTNPRKFVVLNEVDTKAASFYAVRLRSSTFRCETRTWV